MMKMLMQVTLALSMAWFAMSAEAYPEFQAWVDAQTERNVNCAMCHAHGDGPDGVKPGQIGSFDAEQLDALNEARQAFDPGQDIDSPILNAFGNRIVEKLGRTGFIEMRQRPGAFPEAYGFESDIDGDGIPDAREYIDGTLPTNAHHGAPMALFLHNVRANWGHLVLLAAATLLGLFGINNLLVWFAMVTRSASDPAQANDDSDITAGSDSDAPDVPLISNPSTTTKGS